MSHKNNSPDDRKPPVNGINQAESYKTQRAVAKAVAKTVEVTIPEKVVVDNPPPKPNYPIYRVQPGERINLADFDPNSCEHYKKRKTLKRNLKNTLSELTSYKSDCMPRISAAYS
jgi:DNA primase